MSEQSGEYVSAVYDVLVEECGAAEEDRGAFMRNWPACIEWRFVGELGFGGKVWFDRTGRQSTYVNCYIEDQTAIRARIIRGANDRLMALHVDEGRPHE